MTRQPDTSSRYRILARLGAGGMGEVFLALHVAAGGFEKRVALKRLLPHLIGDDRAWRSFLAEARLVAKLDHPNICQVHSLEEIEGKHCIVMEYLEGLPLDRLLARAREADHFLPIPLILGIFTQVCEGLEYAHELSEGDGTPLNLIHRDISPHNLFVTYQGMVKLLDFGIAKTSSHTSETSTGAIKGKTAYMSPEQVQAKPLDGRSDLFSVGISLYESVALLSPFRRDSMFETVRAIVNGTPPSIADLRPALPASLDEVIKHALKGEVGDRVASAADMRRDLERAGDDVGGVWSRGKIADYLKEHHADDIRERQRDLEDWLSTGQGSDDTTTPDSSFWTPAIMGKTGEDVPDSDEQAPTRPRAASVPPIAMDDAPPGFTDAPTRPRMQTAPVAAPSRLWIVGVLAGLVVAGAIALLIMKRSDDAPVVVYQTNVPEPDPRSPAGPAPEPGGDPFAAAVAGAKEQLLSCFREHASGIEGSPEISLQLDVAADGEVTEAQLLPPALDTTALGDCVKATAMKLRPAATGTATRVRIPLRLQAR